MFDIVLHRPEIPPNTGNIIRLCANTGCRLHLIEPLGFALEDRRLRRAGLDYHEWAEVRSYSNLEEYRAANCPPRLFAFSTRGGIRFTNARFRCGDALLFGSETAGLPQPIIDSLAPDDVLRVPLLPDRRSLNLSNAVAVVVYEAWRQLDFAGAR